MKTKLTILAILFSVFSTYSQKNISDVEKYSKKLLQRVTKGNIWVMDTMKSFTGQGSTDWDFDYTEIVLARNSRGLPTLIETSEKIEGTANWRKRYHAELSYFDNDTVFEYKLNEWNTQTNNWVEQLSYYEEKDEEGRRLVQFSRSWGYDEYNDTYRFISGNKEIYTYNANGFKTEKLDNDWNNDTWEDFFRTTYTYDVNNNLTLDFQQRFISEGNWRDNWKTEYSYDENNYKIFEQEWGYDWYYEVWFDYSKVTIENYSNGLRKEEFIEKYDNTKAGWYDSARNLYFYYANNLLDYKEELDLQNSGNNLKYKYTYNSDNQEATFFLYDWNGSNWILFYKVFDEYDTNGNQSSYYSQITDGTWKNFEKEEYTWNEFAVSVNKLSPLKVSIFPNPSSDILNIISERKVNIEIVNTIGQVVFKESSNTSNLKIDVSEFSNGVYFVNVSSENKKNVYRFLKN